jgi:hypothetical protein
MKLITARETVSYSELNQAFGPIGMLEHMAQNVYVQVRTEIEKTYPDRDDRPHFTISIECSAFVDDEDAE